MIRISPSDVKTVLRGGKMTSHEIEEAIRRAKKVSQDEWDEISPLPFSIIVRILHDLERIDEIEISDRGRSPAIEYSLGSKIYEPREDKKDDDREEERIDDPNQTPTTK